MLRWIRDIIHQRKKNSERELQSLREAVTPADCLALIRFVADRGLDPSGDISSQLYSAVQKFEASFDHISDSPDQSRVDAASAKAEMISLYCKLTAITYPQFTVNGRTVRAAAEVNWGLNLILLTGILLFTIAAGTDIASLYFEDEALPPTNTPLRSFYTIHQTVLVYLYPFFWGALGSCVFLAKTLSDKIADGSFDRDKYQGGFTRIFLGAVFGAVAVNIFFDNITQLSGSFRDIGPAGTAFVCGLGVKAVYGGFMKVVDQLHNAIQSIGNGGGGPPPPSPVATAQASSSRPGGGTPPATGPAAQSNTNGSNGNSGRGTG